MLFGRIKNEVLEEWESNLDKETYKSIIRDISKHFFRQHIKKSELKDNKLYIELNEDNIIENKIRGIKGRIDDVYELLEDIFKEHIKDEDLIHKLLQVYVSKTIDIPPYIIQEIKEKLNTLKPPIPLTYIHPPGITVSPYSLYASAGVGAVPALMLGEEIRINESELQKIYLIVEELGKVDLYKVAEQTKEDTSKTAEKLNELFERGSIIRKKEGEKDYYYSVYRYISLEIEKEKNIKEIIKELKEYSKIHEDTIKEVIANTYMKIGMEKEPEYALEYFENALNLYEEIGNRLGMASVYNNIGNVYTEQYSIEKAQNYYKKALEIYNNIGYKEKRDIVLKNLESLQEISE